jgi:hypothetical protein
MLCAQLCRRQHVRALTAGCAAHAHTRLPCASGAARRVCARVHAADAQSCHRDLVAHDTITCPLCLKCILSDGHKEAVWRHLDEQVRATPMPEEYRDVKVCVRVRACVCVCACLCLCMPACACACSLQRLRASKLCWCRCWAHPAATGPVVRGCVLGPARGGRLLCAACRWWRSATTAARAQSARSTSWATSAAGAAATTHAAWALSSSSRSWAALRVTLQLQQACPSVLDATAGPCYKRACFTRTRSRCVGVPKHLQHPGRDCTPMQQQTLRRQTMHRQWQRARRVS